MNDQWSEVAANAIAHWAEQAGQAAISAANEQQRPSVLFRPKLSKDGNQWCALLGNNLQEGCAGFGDTPADAMWRFDTAWYKKGGA